MVVVVVVVVVDVRRGCGVGWTHEVPTHTYTQTEIFGMVGNKITKGFGLHNVAISGGSGGNKRSPVATFHSHWQWLCVAVRWRMVVDEDGVDGWWSCVF